MFPPQGQKYSSYGTTGRYSKILVIIDNFVEATGTGEASGRYNYKHSDSYAV